MIRFRRVLGGTSVLALLLSLTTLASPAAATHVECGDVITENTTLDSDLGPCAGDGLVIAADNVTLDLGGHTIVAANGEGDNAGVRLDGVTGVTVQNGTVTGFDAGVLIEGGSGNTVQRITAVDNINDMLSPPCDLGEGIAILDSDNNTVTHNQLIHNGPFGGVSIIGDSDANVIRRNEFRDHNVLSISGGGCGRGDQDEGVRIEGPGADNNIVDRNIVTNSLLAGIGVHGYVCESPNPNVPVEDPNTGNVITRNVVTGSAGSLSHGIALLQQGPAQIVCPAFATTIERNTVTDNEGDGIFVAANSFDNQINRNLVERNQGSGIYLHGPRMSNQFTNVGPTVFDLVSPDRPPYVECTATPCPPDTDFVVLSGSGSGDVTGRLVAIGPISIPPGDFDTTTSGCDPEDYAAAGFEPGDIALVQRGFCARVQKIQNAVDAGASAVIFFNEGTEGRTGVLTAGVSPVDIPVIGASFAVGEELYNLTQAGDVVVHVVTNTTNVQTVAAPGAYDNVLLRNVGQGNAEFDGFDGTEEPPCDNNRWEGNNFGTVNQPCVAAGGRGKTPRSSAGAPGNSAGIPGRSGDAPGHGGDLNDRGRGNRPASTPA
ncbi:MAG: right-handed parallel beta-helix repeat-containing protein [Actinobacteria bacterium]|nr:right-handed parallel beta-helix repeat-containing protein [Actinomycetota bacterium]